jgi:hypothetical protein
VRRTVPSLVSVALCILLAECAPQGSLFPVCTSDDVYFDESLDGSWRTMDSDQKSDGEPHLSFKGDKDGRSYLVVATSDEKKDVRMFMEARLVHIGKYEFIDFATPSEQTLEGEKIRDSVFPVVSGHIFARLHKESAGFKLRFLDDRWTKDEAEAGRLKLGHADTPDGIVLSAPTSELRQFALEHAEDEKAHSCVEYLVRDN